MDNDNPNNLPANPNPFANAVQVAAPATSIAAVSAREIAAIQGKLVVARSNPRNPALAYDKAMVACERPGLAEKAVYSFPRGGQDVSGPSIRLAEALAACWGNMEANVVEVERRHGTSIVETYAWDLETNFIDRKTFEVSHTVGLKNGGKKVLTDPRDIYEHVANMGARRKRACILAILPGDLVDAAVRKCEESLQATVKVTPETIALMVATFADDFGVLRAQLEKRIGKRLEAMSPANMAGLRKVYASLRDEMSDVADWFDPPEGETSGAKEDPPAGGSRADALAAKLKGKPKAADTTPPDPPATEESAKGPAVNPGQTPGGDPPRICKLCPKPLGPTMKEVHPACERKAIEQERAEQAKNKS